MRVTSARAAFAGSLRVLALACLLVGSSSDILAQAVSLQGRWELKGRDLQPWQAVLSLRQVDAWNYHGCFVWFDGGRMVGVERVRGRHLPERTAFRMQSQEIRQTQPTLGPGATYEAMVSADGQRLFNGTWFGDAVEAGVWQARRQAGPLLDECLGAHAP